MRALFSAERVTPVAAALAFSAALGYNGPGEHFLLLVVTTAVLLIWLAALAWHDLGAGRAPYPSGTLPWLMAALLAWLLLGWIWSSWPQMSFAFAWMVGGLPLSFLIWMRQNRVEELWPRVWLALAAVAAAAAVWGCIQYLRTADRVTGPLLDYNAYGAVLYAFLIPALAYYIRDLQTPARNFWRLRAAEIAFALLLTALFATYSRSAITVWLVGSAAILLLSAVGRYRRVLVAAAVIGMLALGTYWAVKAYPEETISRPIASAVADPASDPSTHHRLLMWRSTWEIYTEHPWLGTGLGTFRTYYKSHRDPAETGSSGDLAHNDYLQLLQEGGPVMLGLVLAVGLAALALLIRLLGRFRRASGGDRDRLLEALALMLVVGGLFAQALITFIFYMLPLALITGLYLAHARRAIALGDAWRSATAPIRPIVLKSSFVVVIGLALGTLVADGLIAAVLQGQVTLRPVAEVREDRGKRIAFSQVMAAVRPANPVPKVLLGESFRATAQASESPLEARLRAGQAVRNYVGALQVHPRSTEALTGLGQVIAAYPSLADALPDWLPGAAEELLRRAVRLDPIRAGPYHALADFLIQHDRETDALEVLTERAPRWFGIDLYGEAEERRFELLVKTMELAHRLERDDIARKYAEQVAPRRPEHELAQQLAGAEAGS